MRRRAGDQLPLTGKDRDQHRAIRLRLRVDGTAPGMGMLLEKALAQDSRLSCRAARAYVVENSLLQCGVALVT